MAKENNIVTANNWQSLQQYTAARIALGRTGVSVPAKEMLQFKIAHAHARDAVYSSVNKDVLIDGLQQYQLPILNLKTKATDRHVYLQRPDFGRSLSDESLQTLQAYTGSSYDINIIVGDGLSAAAINNNAFQLLKLLIPKFQTQKFKIAPLTIVEQARVAVGDVIGETLNASLTIMLIGERPGLSSPDSMGVYITYKPKVGLTDESRNCISNIREDGLLYKTACEHISFLINDMFAYKESGIRLSLAMKQAQRLQQ